GVPLDMGKGIPPNPKITGNRLLRRQPFQCVRLTRGGTIKLKNLPSTDFENDLIVRVIAKSVRRYDGGVYRGAGRRRRWGGCRSRRRSGISAVEPNVAPSDPRFSRF